MISFGDALLLASTKLRTRKVRTVVTATLAGLMFVVIVFVFAVARGAVDSYSKFTDNSLSERYIADLTFFDHGDMRGVYSSPEMINEAESLHKKLVAEKTAEARRLGVDYDPRQETPVTITYSGEDTEVLNDQNRSAKQVIDRYQQSSRDRTKQRIAEMAAPYDPIAQYESYPLGDTGGLTVMQSGRENLTSQSNDGAMDDYVAIDLGSGIETMSYLPLSIVEPYLLEGIDRTVMTELDQSIPVIVPYSQAEVALGLEGLDRRRVSNQQRIERLEDVKRRAAGAIIEVCYRNAASQQQLEMVRQQIRQAENQADDPNYQPPAVRYALPSDTSCGPPTIVSDSRSASERDYEDRQYRFALKFGDETAAVERKLTFRIVGIAPDTTDWGQVSTLESLLMSVGGSSLQGRWVVPTEMIDQTLRSQIVPVDSSQPTFWLHDQSLNLIEFASATDIRRFADEQTCSDYCMDDKPYVSYFGSNSVLVDEIMSGVVGVMKWVVLVVAIIAMVMMAGMAGRVMTDSRRETAVFRAIGARRNDIRLIYLLYMTMFALIVAVIAVGLGLLAAWGLSIWQADSLTTAARLMFIESNYAGQYSLLGIWPLTIVAVVGVIVLTGLVSALLPLARNLVRSPLRDMRDE